MMWSLMRVILGGDESLVHGVGVVAGGGEDGVHLGCHDHHGWLWVLEVFFVHGVALGVSPIQRIGGLAVVEEDDGGIAIGFHHHCDGDESVTVEGVTDLGDGGRGEHEVVVLGEVAPQFLAHIHTAREVWGEGVCKVVNLLCPRVEGGGDEGWDNVHDDCYALGEGCGRA